MAAPVASTSGGGDGSHNDFVHEIAIEVSPRVMDSSYTHADIQLSRMMNAINPNDLLAKRVIDIAKYNRTGDSFIKGEHLVRTLGVRLTI